MVEQGKLPLNELIELTYVRSATHDQTLTLGPEGITLDNRPADERCKIEGVVRVTVTCSKSQCTDVNSRGSMTTKVASKKKQCTCRSLLGNYWKNLNVKLGTQLVLSVDAVFA